MDDKTNSPKDTADAPEKAKAKIYTLYTLEVVFDRADLTTAGWRSDTEIQTAMARFNYAETRIVNIEALRETARVAITQTQKGYSAYRQLVEETAIAHKIARTATGDLATAARIELTPADSGIQEKLAFAGYTTARLTEERAKIEALRAAHAAQESGKGEAQSLTPAQKDAIDRLDDEVMKLRKYARRALAERPQLLEKLGIRAR
jgi:hypothetical protein